MPPRRHALEAVSDTIDARRIALSGGGATLEHWLAPPGERPEPVAIQPDWPFNIIYSSGTTGVPKGIVQPHSMRWAHVQRGPVYALRAGCDHAALDTTLLEHHAGLVLSDAGDGRRGRS